MKRAYELTLLFRILSSDEELQAAIDQVVNWIESDSDGQPQGKVTKIDRNLLGRRRLAYELDGQREGLYIVFKAEIEPSQLAELETNLRLFNPVLRYLIVRDEETEAQDEQEDKEAAEETTSETPSSDESSDSEADADADADESSDESPEEETTETQAPE